MDQEQREGYGCHMKLTVKGLAPYSIANGGTDMVCIDADGVGHYVDLFVDAGLPDGTTPQSLIGRTIECDHLSPFIEIANNVRLVEESDNDETEFLHED